MIENFAGLIPIVSESVNIKQNSRLNYMLDRKLLLI